MAKDYRRRAQDKAPPPKLPIPAWVPYSYGLLTGLTVMGLGWFFLIPAGTPLQWPSLSGTDANVERVMEEAGENKPVTPKFDFYTILPEMEVVVSDEEVAPPAVKKSPVKNQTDKQYRLQLGSFKKTADADRQKARLAMLGVEADIQRVNIASGDTYYRVLSSSAGSKQSLTGLKRRLQTEGVNSLLVQIRR